MPVTIPELLAVYMAARRLITEGLRLTPDSLIVIEREDKSDPHYELCKALDAISPLNPRSTLRFGCGEPIAQGRQT